MNKSKYKVYPNPLNGYYFSFARCHAAEIGAYIIGVGVAVIVSALLVFDVDKGQKWTVLRENIYIPVVCSIPLLFLGLYQTLCIRKVKKIIKDGKKVEGEVVSYTRVRHGRVSIFDSKSNRTILNVKFHQNGEQECSVGVGWKLPQKVLASPRCMVYILNDTVFVSDFELRKKGDPQVEFTMKEQAVYD